MQHALRSRARPLALLLATTLLFSLAIITPAGACTPPDTPFNIADYGSYAVEGAAPNDLVRVGTDVFCASPLGLAVIDASSSPSPSLAATAAAGTAAGLRLDVDGSRAWMIASDGLVYVYDVTDPSAPSLLGSIDPGAEPRSLDVVGDRLYLGAADGLHVLDVSSPPAATQVGFYATLEPVTDVLVIGDVAYLGYSYYTAAASVPVTPQCYPTTVLALDVSADMPVLMGSHQVPDGSVRLAASPDGTILYTAISYPGGSSYLKVFDISTPGSLDYIVALSTGKNGALDVDVWGDLVLLGGMDDVRVYDMRQPDIGYLAGRYAEGAAAVVWAEDVAPVFYGVNIDDGQLSAYLYSPVSERSLGPTRYETAVDLNAEFVTSEYVVLATGRNFPDALAAAPLAYHLGAPILLVEPSDIPSAVEDKIEALGATKAYIIGSTSAISDAVKTELVGLGMASGDIKRLQGSDRYQTAAQIAYELKALKGGGDLATAFIATGENFPDALAASSIAAKMGAPVLLVRQDAVPGATAAAIDTLGVAETIVLGSDRAISDGVLAALPSPTRLGGSDRFGTAKEIADWAIDTSGGGFSTDELFVVTGMNFPDAMPCGVVAAGHSSVMLLVYGDVPPATESYMTARKAYISNIRIVGSTNAISSDVERVLVGLLQ